MNYVGLVLADIHVGAGDLAKLEYEFTELVLKRIIKMDKIDFIVFCGDFFDKKFYLNEKASVTAYKLIKDLINICKSKNVVLRFLYGTESHECGQYDILNELELYDNVKVINHTSIEELLPELHVLYVPEEYIIDKGDFYKDTLYSNHKVDYVFGHGVIKEVMREISIHVSKASEKRLRAPLFKTNELLNICDGEVYFGHYHLNREFDNRVFSIGSFSRWRYGEEERKGFYEITCDIEKRKYHHKYIENTLADPYQTVTFGYNNEIFSNTEELQHKLDKINSMQKHNKDKHTRYIFNVPVNTDAPEITINIIKERLKDTPNTKIEISNGYIEERRKNKKEKLNTENEKFAFIFDKSLSLEDKVQEYIKLQYEKNIPRDDIKKYLYDELSEILK